MKRLTLEGSLRLRLTAWYAGILAAMLVVFSGLVYWGMSVQLARHPDRALERAALEARAILIDAEDPPGLVEAHRSRLLEVTHPIMIREEPGGAVLFRSASFPEELAARGAVNASRVGERQERPLLATVRLADEDFRLASLAVRSPSGRRLLVEAADSLGDIRETMRILRLIPIVLFPLVIIGAALGGLAIAGRALRPIDEVTRLARQIEATNLGERLPAPPSEDELGRLVMTFNEMIDRLDRSFETMRRFTADASHELRTPLTTLRGAVEVTLQKERTAEEYQRVLGEMHQEIEHMTRITQDLLVLARVDAGAEILRREPVDLAEVVSDVVEALRAPAEEKGVTLVPELARDITTVGDERWLRQVIQNLLDNAIKFSSPGRAVRIALGREEGWVTVKVIDQGAGIPEEDLPHVFDRFYRADRARRKQEGGAGLGLAIARWVARSLGGDIRVESRPGLGSTFEVRLPSGPQPPGLAGAWTAAWNVGAIGMIQGKP